MGIIWKPTSVAELHKRASMEELQAENERLNVQVERLESRLTDTQEALCEVYELLVGDGGPA